MFGLQLILYLEKRLVDLNQTLHHVRDDFLEKSADAEALQKTVDEQVRRRRHHGQRVQKLSTAVVVFWVQMFCAVSQQSKSMGEVLCQNVEKDEEIASLKAEIEKLSQKSPVQLKTRTRRGLLANIKESVSSPKRGTSSYSLVKPPRTPKCWTSPRLGFA